MTFFARYPRNTNKFYQISLNQLAPVWVFFGTPVHEPNAPVYEFEAILEQRSKIGLR